MLEWLNAYKGESAASGAALAIRFVLRLFQFVLALTVCGLYGTDLHHASQAGAGADSKWVYAVVIGSMSTITVIVYGVPYVKTYLFFGWDAMLLYVYQIPFFYIP